MSQPTHWQLIPQATIPQWFLAAVQDYTPASQGIYAAQLLWQRGIQTPAQLAGFIDADCYTPTSPFAFGMEMEWAVQRLIAARETGEKVAIWGDFDADGITATSVLWEGLGEFFTPQQQLTYYIPNRLSESHGLNKAGIERLAVTGVKLIVTCDTGSTNLDEINYARELGIDIIVTDHHTLPPERPDVVSIINPRYFVPEHPLFHLSGVAVAYKLVEALYQRLPEVPQHPLTALLDLVAIGLIADLVELKGDCRYLAQRGIQQLQQQTKTPTRPGIAQLLHLCQRSGDRPTDISFGLGPRINAISRIQGDATFCVELLTSRDRDRCQELALETELANTRRKALQRDVVAAVKQKLAQIDLSTTSAIVLADSQWPSGVLGLVAGQIAQEYGRPTVLLTIDDTQTPPMARGSARSANGIDLYQLVHSQAHLLHRFGGHPFAAGLSLPADNLPLFREAINQQLRQQLDATQTLPVLTADLVVTVAQLGQNLFRELRLLEPCGMGNPVPKLLIQNCWFTNVWHNNSKDIKGRQVRYIKTTFEIWDDSTKSGFPGIWWGHYKDELPSEQRCDAIVELDFNSYHKRYEVRLVDVRQRSEASELESSLSGQTWLLDWRGQAKALAEAEIATPPLLMQTCPHSWDELQRSLRQAIAQQRPLALAYPPPGDRAGQQIWEQLVGVAKYLSRTGKPTPLGRLQAKLAISDRLLQLGLNTLSALGFAVHLVSDELQITGTPTETASAQGAIAQFLAAVEEERFRRQYFYQVPLSTLVGIMHHSSIR